MTKMSLSWRLYGLLLLPSAQYSPHPHQEQLAVREVADLLSCGLLRPLPLLLAARQGGLPASLGDGAGLLAGAGRGFGEVADPQGDGALGHPEFQLDAVVRPAVQAQLAGACPQVVLRVGPLCPLRWGLALEEAVEQVVVVDLQLVADLAAAEARTAEGCGLGAEFLVALRVVAEVVRGAVGAALSGEVWLLLGHVNSVAVRACP